MNISYCITVSNEETEFFKLLNHLKPFLREGDEVLVKVDDSKVTENIYKSLQDIKFCKKYKIKSTICKTFNGNFSEWKNEMINYCKNEIILWLDADELPNPQLLEDLPLIMELNDKVDIFRIPRINYVEGITPEYAISMGWYLDENNRINWNSGDFQARIMRNKKGIEWGGQVHETLTGGRLTVDLPKEDEYALLHIKTFDKQKLQNKRYASGDYSK